LPANAAATPWPHSTTLIALKGDGALFSTWLISE
jgi:hypothetical protein